MKQGGALYCDMAVWQPYGSRMAKKQIFAGHFIGPHGKLCTVESYGPSSFEQWEQRFTLIVTACIMFDIVSFSRLDAYRKKIKAYALRYPGCWALIYQVDVRTRLEHSIRVKRNGAEEKEKADSLTHHHEYNADRPWEWVYNELASGEHNWWREQLEEKCHQITLKIASESLFIEGDALVHGPALGHERPRTSPGDSFDCSGSQTRVGMQSGTRAWRDEWGSIDDGEDDPATDAYGYEEWNAPGAMSHAFGSDLTAQESLGAVPPQFLWDVPNKKQKREKYHHWVTDEGSRFTHNRAGVALCEGFQKGQCTKRTRWNFCAVDGASAHQCCKCLAATHGAEAPVECKLTPKPSRQRY